MKIKVLMILVVLFVLVPLVFTQAIPCSKTPIMLQVSPDPGSYTCQAKSGATWTIAYQTAYRGELVVSYDGPKGQFSWEQSVLWSPDPIRYRACTQGSVCWRFTQHLTRSCYECKNIFLEGPFATRD